MTKARTRKSPSVSKHHVQGAALPAFLNIGQLEMQLANSRMPRNQRKEQRKVLRRHQKSFKANSALLEEASVSKACLARYAVHWEVVRPLVLNCKGCLKSAAVVDQLMAGHLVDMYKDGEDLSTARYRVAAFIFHNPVLKSPSMTKLPRVKQSLKGWGNLAPSRSRMPVPWEVACLIARQAFLEGSFHLGLHVLMMFALYLRPTEALRLRCCDVV